MGHTFEVGDRVMLEGDALYPTLKGMAGVVKVIDNTRQYAYIEFDYPALIGSSWKFNGAWYTLAQLQYIDNKPLPLPG